MRKILLIFLVMLGTLLSAQPSMTVNSTGNYKKPYWMAANILVDSTLSIYNMGQNALPLTQANTTQIGYFEANDTAFPVQSGIVMVAAQNASDVIAATNGNGNNVTSRAIASEAYITQTACARVTAQLPLQTERVAPTPTHDGHDPGPMQEPRSQPQKRHLPLFQR